MGIVKRVDYSNEYSLPHLRAVAQAQEDAIVRLKAQLGDVKTVNGDLVTANTTLTREVEELREVNAALSAELEKMKGALALQAKALFGPKSERKPRTKAIPTVSKVPQTGHGPRENPEIETEEVVHELPPDERKCPCCGRELRQMGDEGDVSDLITVTTRAFVRQLHRCLKYYCQCNEVVVTAPGPLRLVPGGRYSPTFAIEAAIAKYCDHLPLERQAHIMRRDGLRMDSQTLWDQIDALAKHLEPTYHAIIKAIQAEPIIHADETRWPLMANGKTKENKLFQAWALLSPDLVAYQILDSRGKQAASTVLGDFSGVLMADGYTVYSSLANEHGRFVVANCWAHVRRKLVEAEVNFPDEVSPALDWIAEMYEVEREATPDTLLQLRAERSGTAVDALMAWATTAKGTALPQSSLAKAAGYMLNLETGLRRYLTDARIRMDNNPCERALRGLALGRKNHYGSRSRRGSEVAAILYTLVESAKLANVPVRAYLQALTEQAIRTGQAVILPVDYARQLAEAPG